MLQTCNLHAQRQFSSVHKPAVSSSNSQYFCHSLPASVTTGDCCSCRRNSLLFRFLQTSGSVPLQEFDTGYRLCRWPGVALLFCRFCRICRYWRCADFAKLSLFALQASSPSFPSTQTAVIFGSCSPGLLFLHSSVQPLSSLGCPKFSAEEAAFLFKTIMYAQCSFLLVSFPDF